MEGKQSNNGGKQKSSSIIGWAVVAAAWQKIIVVWLCGRKGVQEADALDGVQDAYVKLLEGRCHIKSAEELRSWLFKVAFFSFLSSKRRKQPALIGELDEAATGAMPDDVLIKAEITTLVNEAMEDLSERQKQSLVLRHVEEMDWEPIAAELGYANPGSPCNAANAGTKRLKAKLSRYMAS